MASLSRHSLDDKDRKLIAALRDNARLSFSELGRILYLSRSAVQDRFNRLRRDGVIMGFTVRAKLNEVGDLQAWLFVKVTPGLLCCPLVPEVLKITQVTQCYALAGEWDMLVMVTARDGDDLCRLREHIGAVEGVAEVQTQVVLGVHMQP